MPSPGEEPGPCLEPLSERPAITDVPKQEGDGTEDVSVVDVGSITFERLVVTESLGLFVRVDMAAQPSQRGTEVDDLAFLLGYSETLSEVQRDIGLPEDVLGGVTQSEVGAEGQGGEESGHAYAGSFHAPIVR